MFQFCGLHVQHNNDYSNVTTTNNPQSQQLTTNKHRLTDVDSCTSNHQLSSRPRTSRADTEEDGGMHLHSVTGRLTNSIFQPFYTPLNLPPHVRTEMCKLVFLLLLLW